MQNPLYTERLRIEDLSLADAPFIYELLNSPGWLRFIGNRNINNQQQAEAYIQKILDNPASQYWVVKLSDSNTAIGAVTFIQRDYLEHRDIGFAFLETYAKKGYAYEASKRVLDELEKDPANTAILAIVNPDNQASIGLLEKLGLKKKTEIVVEDKTLLLFSRQMNGSDRK